jgi:hypothetical protein
VNVRKACLLAAVLLQLGYAELAIAFRPFDSTDAAVTGAGELQLELEPLGRRREDGKRTAIAPAMAANFGLGGGRELSIEGKRELALDREPGEPRSTLVDNEAFFKHLLRRGSLQDESGPSVAAEYGLLLPSVHAGHGTGFSVAGAVSQRWPAATLHLNAALARNREHEPQVFAGAILEGPDAWRVRPVAELFTEKASGSARVRSALAGAIWRVHERLSFDLGLRAAHAGSQSVRELRLGLTWSVPLAR